MIRNLNNDTVISINDELKLRLTKLFKSLSVVTPGKKCTDPDAQEGCHIWLTSFYSLIPTLDIIGKIPSDISILIQQGKNDSSSYTARVTITTKTNRTNTKILNLVIVSVPINTSIKH